MTSLTEVQQFGRAKNALSDYFVRKLIVPKVFFEVSWAGEPVDLLAIDRTGVGDVHALRFVRHQKMLRGEFEAENATTTILAADQVRGLHSLPAQYRYVVVIDNTGGTLLLEPSIAFRERTFAEDGIGRVGLLYVDVASDDAAIKVVIKPERFRSTAQILALTDEYVATHTADMEYRDPFEYQASA